MKRFLKYLIFLVSFLFIVENGMASPREIKLNGHTMGTTYHIIVIDKNNSAPDNLKNIIENNLKTINNSMSAFITGSEIDRFNKYMDADQPIKISDDFLTVMKVAENIYHYSEGAWDGTIKPIINLWGFGTDITKREIPPEDKISYMLKKSGFDKIKILKTGYLIKKDPSVTLDLASIAKGYGVDFISKKLKEKKLYNFMVEIGGEVYCSGQKNNKKKWKVGVNTPLKNAAYNQIYTVLSLENMALATSGDYRNFFESGNKRYSHVIDPKTGYPVSNGVVSVSIVSDSCAFSDGMATAIMVMGHKRGIELLNRLKSTEGLIIVKNEKGDLINYYSSGFQKLEIPVEGR